MKKKAKVPTSFIKRFESQIPGFIDDTPISKKEKCSGYDYSLVESGRLALIKPNKFICICIHCRAQAIKREDLKHSSNCCLKTATFFFTLKGRIQTMTKKQWESRALAFEEAADHLDLAWTDDECEKEQGKIVSEFLRKQAESCRVKADSKTK